MKVIYFFTGHLTSLLQDRINKVKNDTSIMDNNKGYEDIDKRTFNFAVRVIKMVLSLPNNVAAWKIGGQITDSASSINSNIVHARSGISRKNFVNHYRIALKEAEETRRWLEMIIAVGLEPASRMQLLIKENTEIICILVKIIKNSQNKER